VITCLVLPSLIKMVVISPLATLYGVSTKPRAIQRLLYILAVVRLFKIATFFERMMRLKADVRTLPFWMLPLILVLFLYMCPSFNHFLVLKIHLGHFLLMKHPLFHYSRPSRSTHFGKSTQRKNNKYLRVCADNGVSFLSFIVESNVISILQLRNSFVT